MSIVHCQRDPFDIYIGRGRDPHTGEPSRWGNPFSHPPSRLPGVTVVATREGAIARYRRWLWAEIKAGRIDCAELAALHGKALGCWCAPEPCHGEVLEAAAMWALAVQARRLLRRTAEMSGRACGAEGTDEIWKGLRPGSPWGAG